MGDVGLSDVGHEFIAAGIVLLTPTVGPKQDVNVALRGRLGVDRGQHLVELTSLGHLRATDLRLLVHSLGRVHEEAVDLRDRHRQISLESRGVPTLDFD